MSVPSDATPEQINPDSIEIGDTSQNTLAAIDLGSNSFHLVVARLTNGTLQPLVQDKQLVRLADGLDDNQELSEEAMERGLNVLRSFGETVKQLNPANIRIVATYTLRRAKNRNKFVRAARNIFPLPIEIISGDEEARLIYQGIAHTTHAEGKRLVVDIGGGSTEIVIGEHFDTLQLSSQPMGCISYTRRFFADGTITKKKFKEAETRARQRLEIIDRRFCNTGWDAALGTSGTAKAIAQYAESHDLMDQGCFNLKSLKQMKSHLIAAGQADLIEGVDDARKPVMAAGLSIMIAVFKQLNIDKISVADAALREGVLYELTERMQHQDIRERTVNSLVVRYDIDQEQTRRVQQTAERLYRPYSHLIPAAQTEDMERILNWAITLHEIGLHVNRRGIQRHSKYIIENIEMPGFSDEEQKLLGLLVGSYRKNFQRRKIPEFNQYEPGQIFMLIVILRLSTLLNQRRLDGYIPEFAFSTTDKAAQITFPKHWLRERELIRADLKFEAEVLEHNEFELTIS